MNVSPFPIAKFIFIALVLHIWIVPSFSQEGDIFGIERKISRKSNNEMGNIFRNMISNFSFEISGGSAYHANTMKFYTESPNQYPISPLKEDVDMDLNLEDTLHFRGSQMAMPINVGVRLKLFNLLTLGAGYGREWGQMSGLNTGGYDFNFDSKKYVVDRLYGTVGVVLWDADKRISFLKWRYRMFSENNIYMQSELKLRARQVYPWRVIVEGEFGSSMIRENFDPRISSPDPYYSIGLRIERDFSEYTKFFIKPSVGFRSQQYQHPDLSEIQTMDQTMYGLQLGVSLSMPGAKRCKVGGCGVVMKHIHNGVEYRGSSIWKRQNRKVGEWYGN